MSETAKWELRALKAEQQVTALREALITWAKWWNGPGRENYKCSIVPPITKTDDVLTAAAATSSPAPETSKSRAGRPLLMGPECTCDTRRDPH